MEFSQSRAQFAWWPLLAGVIGLGVFLFLLPQVHPDSRADFSLGEEGARDLAAAYLRESGYDVSDLQWEVETRREGDILEYLQTAWGRKKTNRRLDAGLGDTLPAYHWYTIGYGPERHDEDEDGQFIIRLDPDGQVVSAQVQTTSLYANLVDRDVLGDVFSLDPSMPDTTLFNRLRFAFEEGTNDSTSYQLDSTAAVTMAGRILENTVYAEYGLTADSVYIRTEDPLRFNFDNVFFQANIGIDSLFGTYESTERLATVLFAGSDPSGVVDVEVQVDVTSTGQMHRIAADFNGEGIVNNTENIATAMAAISSIILGILVMVLFFRALHAKQVDVRPSLTDALWGGLFVAMIIAVNSRGMSFGDASMWGRLGLTALVSLLGGLGTAFFVFILSSATDAISLKAWPDKIRSLQLARQFRLYNVDVGRSLFNAFNFAGILLGTLTLLLVVLGDQMLNEGELGIYIVNDDSYFPLLARLGIVGILMMLMFMSTFLGLGSVLYNRKRSMSVHAAVIIIFLITFQVSPYVFETELTWIAKAAFAMLCAWSFWRFDYFTTFMGGLFALTLWGDGASVGMANDHPYALEFWIGIIALTAMGILGFVVMRVGHEVSDETRLIPSYLRDLARQERLQGELDIAREVQMSLLPASMPDVKGVDLGALCLPATEVGGDYYDVIDLGNDRLAVVIGDVSGKGIQAAFYMTLTKGFVRSLCRQIDSPASVLTQLNKLFCENAPSGTFISMIYGVLDVGAKTFTFVRAGHDPIMLRRAGEQQVSFIQPDGMAIGLSNGQSFSEALEEVTLNLEDGDVMFFYTDGMTEAMSPQREQYGTERLARDVAETSQSKAQDLLEHVSQEVQAFARSTGRHDDMTMLLVKMNGIA